MDYNFIRNITSEVPAVIIEGLFKESESITEETVSSFRWSLLGNVSLK